MTWRDASFGSSKTGLATVGVTEYDNTGSISVARATAGVVETAGGGYGRDWVVDPTTVTVAWDTGEAIPIWAHEDIVSESAGIDLLYADGVWIDTTGGGSAGTVLGVNGIQTNPSSNIADAITIAEALPVKQFKIAGLITLPQAMLGYQFRATAGGGAVDANAQDCAGSIFDQVGITGTFNSTGDMFGTAMQFYGTCTNWRGVAVRPGMGGTIVCAPGEVSTFAQAASTIAGVNTPAIDVGGVGTQLNLRAYSGGMTITGMDDATSNASLEFTAGQLIMDATNVDGVIVVRGTLSPITDNTGASCIVVIDGAVQGRHIEDIREDRGLDVGNPKVIVENTPGEDYDEDTTNIHKDVVKVGNTTTFTRT